MKIEKISENQIKFVLSQDDLLQRNMQLRELAYGSDKAQELFREVTERAAVECDFHLEPETPLIIEAIPVEHDGVMVIITRINNAGELDPTGFSTLLSNLGLSRTILPKIQQVLGQLGMPPDMSVPLPAILPPPPSFGKGPGGGPARPITIDRSHAIFEFDSIDQAAMACSRLLLVEYIKDNSLLKYEGKYYLVVNNSGKQKLSQVYEKLLVEYGRKFSSREMSKLYLMEHGEVIIPHDAINILSVYIK